MNDITEDSNVIITLKEYDRLLRIEEAAKAAYPDGWLTLYWRPKAPKLQRLRAALYGDPERA